jgi:hypothetical protein
MILVKLGVNLNRGGDPAHLFADCPVVVTPDPLRMAHCHGGGRDQHPQRHGDHHQIFGQ